MQSTWETGGSNPRLAQVHTLGILSVGHLDLPKLYMQMYGRQTCLPVSIDARVLQIWCVLIKKIYIHRPGTYTIYSGTTYHAVNGTLSGSATILTNSAYSDGEAVGYLGESIFSPVSIECILITGICCIITGNGGSVTLNNIQGNGQGGQWVSLYYANGDSSYRNCTVRCVYHFHFFFDLYLTYFVMPGMKMLSTNNSMIPTASTEGPTSSCNSPLAVEGTSSLACRSSLT
jgi:hypothetical protein